MTVIKKMFTTTETKNLEKLLTKVEDRDNALYLEELHGFFFGLAITPEVIVPSKWLPVIFGKNGPVFDNDEDAQTCIKHLMDFYNRIVSDSNAARLCFPFDYNEPVDYGLMEGWTYGLYLALTLRPHIWGMSEEYANKTDEEIPEDLQEIISACCVITAIALPEERENIYETEPGQPPQTAEEMEDELYDLLPLSVEAIQKYGEQLQMKKIAEIRIQQSGKISGSGKVGRNDLCPCGSGKKYKKCCGAN